MPLTVLNIHPQAHPGRLAQISPPNHLPPPENTRLVHHVQHHLPHPHHLEAIQGTIRR